MTNGNWRCPGCNAAGAWTELEGGRMRCDNCRRTYTKQTLRVTDARDAMRRDIRKGKP